MLSQNLKNIAPSPTLMISQKAARLKKEGLPIIVMSAGEPDFPTPDHVIEAAIAAMKAGKTRYTPVAGTLELRESISAYLLKNWQLTYALDEMMVSNGAKQIIFNAFQATLNQGDEVIIPAPYWVSYPSMVEINGGKPVFVNCLETPQYKLSPQALEAAITSRTKWLVLNYPSNPTGAVYTRTELQNLGEVLAKHAHVHILTDEIYDHMTFEQASFVPFLSVCPHLKNRTILVNGVSKTYAMTGWRIGYGCGPKSLIKPMVALQSQSTSAPCAISQEAARAALEGDQNFLKERCAVFKRRRDVVVQKISQMDGLQLAAPEGAFYAFIDARAFLNAVPQLQDDLSLCDFFLDEAHVAVVPGSAFGAPGFFRLSFALSDEELQEGLNRIHRALSNVVDLTKKVSVK